MAIGFATNSFMKQVKQQAGGQPDYIQDPTLSFESTSTIALFDEGPEQ